MILATKVFFTSFVFGFILFPYFIKLLKKISKDGQPIRSCGPESHLITKKNVPPMGGIIILISSLLPILLWAQLTLEILLLILITLFFALLGFIDDYLKLKTNHYRGLSAKTKILIQFIVTLVSMSILKLYSAEGFTKTSLFKGVIIDFGYLYVPFAAFVIVGSANAVNLTDGLDGLAATQVITSFAFLGLIAYITQADMNITLFCIAFIGAILSFLWFNTHPAKIFMGDVGSLSIGAALGLTSVLMKREMLFAVIGIIFVIETLSVIIQISYFKYTKFKYGEGKRVFLMAPIHHHFEKKGWSENVIVMKFWIISIICSVFTITFLLSKPMKYPDFTLENKLSGVIAGVDEVGRGPLAGPVISAAVVFIDRNTIIDGINDSKKLTPQCRQVLYEKITSVAKFGIGMASVEEINSYNILQATKLSMKRALIDLDLELDYVLVDGNQPPEVKWQVKSIVNGDNLSTSIAAASIVAKVTRDRLMQELHNKHPEYNWYKNKGYGTKEHLNAIGLYGITEHHRKNFAPISRAL